MAKDALDKILDGDLDLYDEDGNPIEPDDGLGDDAPSAADFKTLQDKLEAVEKEKHGMLKTVQSERTKRQSAANELAELRGTVNGILQTRQQGAPDPEPKDETLRAAVKYTDDGDGYVELSKESNPEVDALTQELKELKEYIVQTDQARQTDAQGDELIQSIVGEKPEYGAAYGTYQAAHRWLDDRVSTWQSANGVQRALTGGEALDYVFQDDKEFNEAFPGVNIADVLFAEDSKYQLRTMLENVSKGSTPDLKKPDSRFQKIMNKPSGLGEAANAKAEVSVVERAGSLSSTDIMALSDEAADQLEKAMRREERAEGIKFN